MISVTVMKSSLGRKGLSQLTRYNPLFKESGRSSRGVGTKADTRVLLGPNGSLREGALELGVGELS